MVVEDTDAVLAIGATVVPRAMPSIVNVTEPTGRSNGSHVTVVSQVVPPPGVTVTEPGSKIPATASVTTTSRAVDGPAFVTTSV